MDGASLSIGSSTALVAHCQPRRVHRAWVLDDAVDAPISAVYPELGISRIVAAETVSSYWTALPVALQHGFTEVALGITRSTDEHNLLWDRTGEEINYLWGMSAAAEQLLHAYVRRELVANVTMFHLLRPIYDINVFSLLRRDLDAVPSTHSCAQQKPWCCRCAKCLYVWMNYVAWLPPETVTATFDVNLFDLPENRTILRKMLGLESYKPTDCIGTVSEARLAFAMCRAEASAASSPTTSTSPTSSPRPRPRSTTTARSTVPVRPTRVASSSRSAPSCERAPSGPANSPSTCSATSPNDTSAIDEHEPRRTDAEQQGTPTRSPAPNRSCSPVGTRRSRRARVTSRCRPTSQPCPVGSARWASGSTSSIVRTVPDVHKAVKWNQPFYGHEGEGWFLAFRCYTKYVQLQFFRGTSLDPVPPKASKHDEVRYLDIHEDDDLDEDQLVSWIEQASNLPGEKV